MAHLLHLDSSLRSEGSRSRRLSAHYAKLWSAAHPDGTVTYRDLAVDPIPHLDEAGFTAAFTPEADRTPEQNDSFKVSTELIDELVAADTVVVGLPLYNFSVPSTFKAWFDRIVSERTLGRLTETKLVVVTARGGGYGPGTPREGWDHREPWLRHAVSNLGITDVTFVDAELTLARESPQMIPLDLGAAEDQSFAAALAAIEELLAA
ncbi:NAD(P)H-dependent oxidoreductase [Sporichthya brevicatena]|uniref:FMN dependent NADH:quinone oxidoreductase n=1 Tax=Sporichthya brevicatena TaxID=171442 RepID=A0ABP3RWR2_9ACTN